MLLYDMGASSTVATVVSYQIAKMKEKGIVETNPQLTIHGVGYVVFKFMHIMHKVFLEYINFMMFIIGCL